MMFYSYKEALLSITCSTEENWQTAAQTCKYPETDTHFNDINNHANIVKW